MQNELEIEIIYCKYRFYPVVPMESSEQVCGHFLWQDLGLRAVEGLGLTVQYLGLRDLGF